MRALAPGYQDAWLSTAAKANDTDRVVQLLELGLRPTGGSLVLDALTAGNWELAALLRAHGAPLSSEAQRLLSPFSKVFSLANGVPVMTRIALWEFVLAGRESALVVMPPLRARAVFRHWVRALGVVLYWRKAAVMPGSKAYFRAAERFRAACADVAM